MKDYGLNGFYYINKTDYDNINILYDTSLNPYKKKGKYRN